MLSRIALMARYRFSHSIEPLVQPYLNARKAEFQKYSSSVLPPLQGSYTIEGGNAFAARHQEVLMKPWISDGRFKVSNVGVGTYQGSLNEQDDIVQFNAIVDSVLSGVNTIDTCANFRGGRSEKVVVSALQFLTAQKKYERSQLLIATKAGYVREKLDDELANEVLHQHCVHEKYLSTSLNRSLEALKLKTVDIFYLNNFSESQMYDLGKEKFYQRMQRAFDFCEKARSQNKIKYYGLSSWQSFRVPLTDPIYLSLAEVVKAAEKIGGKDHGFKFLQIPINLMMPQAFAEKNQQQGSLLQSAESLKINIISSSPLMCGSLINIPLPSDKLNCRSNGAKHLQLIRSIPSPALVCTLVGHKTNRHTKKNLEVLKAPLLTQQEWFQIFVPQSEPNQVQA